MITFKLVFLDIAQCQSLAALARSKKGKKSREGEAEKATQQSGPLMTIFILMLIIGFFTALYFALSAAASK